MATLFSTAAYGRAALRAAADRRGLKMSSSSTPRPARPRRRSCNVITEWRNFTESPTIVPSRAHRLDRQVHALDRVAYEWTSTKPFGVDELSGRRLRAAVCRAAAMIATDDTDELLEAGDLLD